MKYEKLSTDLLREVGGSANIAEAYHCVTRLRLKLRDTSTVDVGRVSTLDAVMGAQLKGDELQVIIGPDVKRAYEEFSTHHRPSTGDQTEDAASAEKKRMSPWNGVVGFLAAVFVPIIPALAGAGMVKSLIALLTAFGWLPVGSDVATILNIVGDGVFYFLPFFLAVSAARRLKTNEFLALALAAALLYPTVTAGAAAGAPALSLFGVPVPLVNYATSVIPILLGVALLSAVSRALDRVIHENLKIILVPLFSLIIVIPVTLAVLAPLGFYAGTLLAEGVQWVFGVSGILASALLGAALPLIVMTGMHAVFAPIILGNLGSTGIDVILPLFFFGTLSVSGAAIAVFVRSRNAKRRATALSSGLSAFVGITEPATYGVNLPLRRPFIAAMVGGGLASAIAFAMGVRAFSYAMPSVLSIPTYLDAERGSTITGVLVGMITAFGVSFLMTLLWWQENPADRDGHRTEATELVLSSPVAAGRMLPLADVDDAAFTRETMGPTLAFAPSSDTIVAPAAGRVVAISAARHAVGLRTDDGTEILLHIGIDTVTLGGTPFAVKVEEGEWVEAGQQLVVADLSAIRSHGLVDAVLMVLTNRDPSELRRTIADAAPVTADTRVATIPFAAVTAS